jgi:hypothetical protein
MSFTLARAAAGFGLLAALAAGCGSAAAGAHPATTKPPVAQHQQAPAMARNHHAPAMHRHHGTATQAAPATPASSPTQTANPIPQGNGGDQDADNNGGPSDGDGNL